MEEISCYIRIFEIKRMETSGETGTVWIEVVQEGKKNLFRIRCHSEKSFFLIQDGNSSPDQALIDCILKRLLERNIIPEDGILEWTGGTKES